MLRQRGGERMKETYEEINTLIKEYSVKVINKIKNNVEVNDDVIALAGLINASANYKMSYRCMESGSTIR